MRARSGYVAQAHGIPPTACSSKRTVRLINGIALDQCRAREHYPARRPFRNVVEGVRIDEELARKGPGGLPPWWFTPSRVRISLPPPTLEEVRHRRGHRLEIGCRFDLSWVRFPLLPPFSSLLWFAMLATKSLCPSRVCFVNEGLRHMDITSCPAAKAELRSCRHVIHARISFTRPGIITSFATCSLRSKQF